MNHPYIQLQQSGTACVFEVTGLQEAASHQFKWDFGDGTSSEYPKPTHIYQQSGSFSVAVIVEEVLADGSKKYHHLNTTLTIASEDAADEAETGTRDVGGVHVKKERAKN